eukprot:TRINITY_DN2283_c0_g1_i1.p1 TRINITY_DN2283_c0_g1~~TRINITY_DN2283_c0_g1_i1.p1  ORF type:complete len:738 (+),score=277.67 TRINITY_DN2283_c0_g1_i1:101-2215(+)
MTAVAQSDAGDGHRSTRTSMQGPTFQELKNQVFFTEKRLALLLQSQFYPELNSWVKEKCFVRQDCKSECADYIAKLERCISGKMRGVWHALRIISAFQVEVDQDMLVGSEWYRTPKSATKDSATRILAKIRELCLAVPGKIRDGVLSQDALQSLVDDFERLDWSDKDMSLFEEAFKSREQLLSEVSELSKSLQEVDWQCSIQEVQKEELRRKGRDAAEKGEMELFESHCQEEISVSEALMQLFLFKLQQIESSQAENHVKLRSNVSNWKLAAAQLEYLKEKKADLTVQCQRDEGRLARGLDLEKQKDEKLHQDFCKRKEDIENRLHELDHTQDELAEELQDLVQKYKVVEEKLVALVGEREKAITTRVDMIETEMQRVADYEEFVVHAKQHNEYVRQTREMAEEAETVIARLQGYLMDRETYAEHDFHTTSKLIENSKKATLKQLNHCYVDYCRNMARLGRRMDAKIRQTEEEATRNQVTAECLKETLNPEAKKFVTIAHDMFEKVQSLKDIKAKLESKVEFGRETYLQKVKEGLPEHEVDEAEDEMEDEALNRRDRLLAMREELEYQKTDNALLDEKEALVITAERISDEKQEKRERKESAAARLRQQVDAARTTDDGGSPTLDSAAMAAYATRLPFAASSPRQIATDDTPAPASQPAAVSSPRADAPPAAAAAKTAPDPSGTEPRALEGKYGQNIFPTADPA